MPTDVANNLGTARQFIPKPDAKYQGRFAELTPQYARASDRTYSGIGASLQKLSVAFSDFVLNTEKYKEQMGTIEANKMINMMTPEDVEKLNVIDAAQTYGFVSSLDNPYFKANADRIRGGLLSAKMKQEYDAEYAMSPAKSADEETRRYSQFSSDYKKKLYDNDATAPQNSIAFEMGFNENNQINANKLTQDWYKTKHTEDMQVTFDASWSKLGGIVANSGELLKTNGAMTEAVQSVFNEQRLMALPPEMRHKLLDDFCKQLVTSGHIDGERLGQMMDNIVVQTHLDGTTDKASDLLNMAMYKIAANDYQNQFYTQEKYDFTQKYINMGETGLKSAFEDLEKIKFTDPEQYKRLAGTVHAIQSGIEQKKREAAIAARLAHQNRYKIESPDGASAIIQAWLSGADMFNGLPITSYKIDPAELQFTANRLMATACQSGDAQSFFRIAQLPQMKDFRNSISANITSQLAGIKPTDDGGTTATSAPQLINLAKMVMNNPKEVALCFGGEVAKQGRILKSLCNTAGSDEAGLRLYSYYNNADSETIEARRSEIEAAFSYAGHFTAEGVQHLDSLNNEVSYDTIDFYENCNQYIKQEAIETAIAYACTGMSTQDALYKAGEDFQSNYVTYHWGGFPKGVYYKMGTPDDSGWFTHGLDAYIYQVGDTTSDYENTKISYNPASQTFTFTNVLDGRQTIASLEAVRQESIDAYNRAVNYQNTLSGEMNNEETSSDYTADDINAETFSKSEEITNALFDLGLL